MTTLKKSRKTKKQSDFTVKLIYFRLFVNDVSNDLSWVIKTEIKTLILMMMIERFSPLKMFTIAKKADNLSTNFLEYAENT